MPLHPGALSLRDRASLACGTLDGVSQQLGTALMYDLPRQGQNAAYVGILRARYRSTAGHGLEHNVGESLEQRRREQHIARGDMRYRIGSFIGKSANVFQLQFMEASLDRLLVGSGITQLVANEQESPAGISLVQESSSIQRQQVVLGRRDAPNEAGNENFLTRPEGGAQRGCRCSFQVGGRKIDTVPHHVCTIRGYPVQAAGECEASVRVGNQRRFPAPGERITRSLSVRQPIVVTALGVDDGNAQPAQGDPSIDIAVVQPTVDYFRAPTAGGTPQPCNDQQVQAQPLLVDDHFNAAPLELG